MIKDGHELANDKSPQDQELGNSSKSRVDPIDYHVGKRLKRRRLILGLSQQDLADVVDVSVQQVQKYEKATNRISSGKLFHFANLLQVPVRYFFDDTRDTNVAINNCLAEPQEDFLHDDAIPEREVLSLVRAYNDIRDIQVRRKILDLVKSLSSNDNEETL